MNSKLKFSIIFVLTLLFGSPLPNHAQDVLPGINGLIDKGDSLFAINKLDSAKEVFKRTLKADKNSLHSLSMLGKIAVEQKNWGEAKDCFGKILKQNSENLEAHFYRGISYRESGKFKALLLRKLDWNKSKKHFLNVIKQDSLYKDVIFQFARLKRYREKYDEAIELVHRQIRLRPELEGPRVKLFRYYRYYITNVNKKAANKWLQNSPYVEAKYAIGEMYRRIGKFDQADSIFQSLLKKSFAVPVQPIYLSLARLYSRRDQPEKGEKNFWLAVENIKNKVEADLVFEDVKYVVKDHELDKFVSLKTKKQRF